MRGCRGSDFALAQLSNDSRYGIDTARRGACAHTAWGMPRTGISKIESRYAARIRTFVSGLQRARHFSAGELGQNYVRTTGQN